MENACRAADKVKPRSSRARDDFSATSRASRNLHDCGAASGSPPAGWMHPLASMPVSRQQAAPRCRATRQPDRQPSVPIGWGAREITRARQGTGGRGGAGGPQGGAVAVAAAAATAG